MSSSLLGVTTFVYFLCMVISFCYMFFRNSRLYQLVILLAVAGFLFNTAGLGFRWYESYQLGHGRIPVTNLYEALVSLSWTTLIFYFWIEYKYRLKVIALPVFFLVSISMAYASLSPNVQDEILPLIPALQSNWLTYHVLTCFLAYSGFAVSFGASIFYLVKSDGKEHKNISYGFENFDEIIYKTAAIGFLFLTLGIATGSVWASYAWGSYWSWDPKETWSLITWFVYAAFLHARIIRGWSGKRMAWISVAGFVCVLFTFLGVNFLLSGLHSYA